MAYDTKYQFQSLNGDGDVCTVQIQQDGYSGGVTGLTPAADFFRVTWGQEGQQDLTRPLQISNAELRFIGDSDGQAALQDIFDSSDTEYRVRFLVAGSLEWQGFVATDLRRYNPWIDSETVKLEALDGLALLENRPAFMFDGLDYIDLYNIIRHVLRPNGENGLHDLPIYTSMNWHAYGLDFSGAGSECPLMVLDVPKKAYQELNDQGNVEESDGPQVAVDQRTQLEDICERFGLQLFQAGGAWHLRQRDQIEDGTSLKRWKMPTGEVDFDPATVDDVTATLPASRRTREPVSGVQRLRALKSVHSYDNLGNLIENPSFEDGLSAWKTLNPDNISTTFGAETPKYDDIDQLVTASTQDDKYLLRILPNANNNDEQVTVYQTADAVVEDPGPLGAYRFQMDLAAPNLPGLQLYVEDGSTTYYAEHDVVDLRDDALAAEEGGKLYIKSLPGEEGRIIIPEGARLPIVDTTDTDPNREGEITLSEPARGGDTILRGKISANVTKASHVTYWYWTKTESQIGTPSWALTGSTIGSDSLVPQQFDLPRHTPTGEAVVGPPGVSVQPLNGFDGIGLDHVSVEITIDGEPIEETRFIALDDQYGREQSLQHRIGDGPTAFHPRRIFRGADDLLDNWKPGPYSSNEVASGKGLEQVLAEQWMRQLRGSLDRRTYDLEIRGETVAPTRVYAEDGTDYTVTFLQRTYSVQGDTARIELTEKADFGLSDLRQAFSMSSDAATGGGSGGTTFVGSQTIDGASTWDELTGKPFTTIGSGLKTAPNSLEVEPADFAGHGLEDDGSDNLRLDAGAVGDGLLGGDGTDLSVNASDLTGDGLTSSSNDLEVDSSVVRTGRTLTGGDGIQSIGNLSSDRTVAVDDTVARDEDTERLAKEIVQAEAEIDALDAVTVRRSREVTVAGTTDQVDVSGRDGALDEDVSLTLSLPQDIDTAADVTFKSVTLGSEGAAIDEAVRADRTITGGDGIQSIGNLTADRTVAVDSTVARTDQNETFQQNVTVQGDLTVNGTEFVTNTETVEIEDNLAIINENETGSGVTEGFAGWQVDRGTLDDFDFGFDETRDRFVAGKTTGTLQVVATRQDNPDDKGVPFYDSPNHRFNTTADFLWKDGISSNGMDLAMVAGIGHQSFQAELSKWYIYEDGDADFRSVYADELRVERFIAEVEEALAGKDFLTKSFAKLDEDFTVPSDNGSNKGGTNPLTVQNLPGLSGSAVFQEDDTIRLRYVDRSGGGLVVSDIWLRVTKPTDFDASGETQTWTAEALDDGGVSGTDVPSGSIALDYGDPSTGGYLIERSVLADAGGGAPYDRIVKWTDQDNDRIPDTYDTRNYRGDLSGIADAYGDGPGVFTHQLRAKEDVIVGDLAAATGNGTGGYLKYNGSTFEVVVDTSGGQEDVGTRLDEIQADLELIAKEVSQEQASRAGLEVRTSENKADIRLNAEVIGDDSKFSKSTLSLQAEQNETEIDTNASAITNLESKVDRKGQDSLTAYASLTLAAEQTGENTSAITSLENKVDRDGQDTLTAYNSLTLAAEQTGNNASAITTLENKVDRDGQDSLTAYNSLTLAAEQTGDNASAITTLENKVDREGQDTLTAYNSLTLAAEQTGDNASAITTLESKVDREGQDSLTAYASLTLAAEQTGDNESAITTLESKVDNGGSDTLDQSVSSLTLAANENRADIELVAKRLTQERESRAGLELQTSENKASIEANASVIGDDGLFSQSTLSLHASQTETRFSSSVQYENDSNANSDAAIKLKAGPGGSTAVLEGDSIRINGDTSFYNGSGIPGTDLADDYTAQGEEAQTFRQSDEPVDSDAEGRDELQAGDVWIDTDDGDAVYTHDGSNSNPWIQAYTNIDGGNITTGTVDADRIDVTDLFAKNIEINSGGKIRSADTWSANEPYLELRDTGYFRAGDSSNYLQFDPNGSFELKLSGDDVETKLNDIESGLELVAKRVTQEAEARAGLEITASETEARFEANVRFEDAVAGISLVANDTGSSVQLTGDSIQINGDTTFFGTNYTNPNGIPGDALENNYTLSGTENVTIRGSGEPDSSTTRPNGDSPLQGDLYIDTSDGNRPYNYDGNSWSRAYTAITGGDIKTGSVTADEIDVDDLYTEDATISATLDMTTVGIIKFGSLGVGGGRFEVGDIPRTTVTRGPFSSDLSITSNGGPSGSTVTLTDSDSDTADLSGSLSIDDVSDWEITVLYKFDIDEGSSADSDGQVTVKVTPQDVNGNATGSTQSQTHDPSTSREAEKSLELTAPSGTTQLKIERQVEATDSTSSTTARLTGVSGAGSTVRIKARSPNDFLSGSGFLYRDQNGDRTIEADALNGTLFLSGALTQNSDRRYKSGIEPITGGLDVMRELEGITYDRGAGIAAQDLIGTFEDALHGSEEEGYSVDYTALWAPAIGAFQQLHDQSQDHERRIKQLERENERLRQKLNKD